MLKKLKIHHVAYLPLVACIFLMLAGSSFALMNTETETVTVNIGSTKNEAVVPDVNPPSPVEDKIITQDVSTVDLNTGGGKIDVKFDLKGQGGNQKRLMSTSASTSITPRNDGKIATLSICGDDICDRENGEYGSYGNAAGSCSKDCGNEVCGDGICSAVETCNTCSVDCGNCACGNGQCEATKGESCKTCPADCHSCCGNGRCDSDIAAETCSNCPVDCGACPAICGNGTCEAGETSENCSQDCGGAVCGNGICDPGENCTSCPEDPCGNCPDGACECNVPVFCGNGICDPGEACYNCGQDCPVPPEGCKAPDVLYCGDGLCTAGVETCRTCPADCGSCIGGGKGALQ